MEPTNSPQVSTEQPNLPPSPQSSYDLVFYLSILLFLLSIIVGTGYVLFRSGNIPFLKKEVACTQDAKICPDGTAVGREGSNCEFAPCPEASVSATPSPVLSPTNLPTLPPY